MALLDHVVLQVDDLSTVGAWYDRRTKTERAKQLGVLVASGMIVGESLFGVLNAGLIAGFNRDAPLAVVGADFPYADAIGAAVFVALIVFLYAWLFKRNKVMT